MTEIGDSIIKGLEEALAYSRGEPVAVRVHHARVPDAVDVRAIRSGMGMTQREFAGRFGFSLGTLRNWERGHRHPEGAARAFLAVIAPARDCQNFCVQGFSWSPVLGVLLYRMHACADKAPVFC